MFDRVDTYQEIIKQITEKKKNIFIQETWIDIRSNP